eukprot:283817-Chlamydomonas_euryale.AAC.1
MAPRACRARGGGVGQWASSGETRSAGKDGRTGMHLDAALQILSIRAFPATVCVPRSASHPLGFGHGCAR